ncbi:MAG TPA: sigma-70 family RNA polymerase sigma factor [Steroidobacteraceae bacterium]|jgi:RNA polymerase sigma-70 factor (ECF subfamily)|nr:sigma-70 family RNA polymerase sigma factor [Steroidobacteraceae bacterium]
MSDASDLLQSRILELLPKLRRFARSLTRNPHDADDLLQAALERALTHLEQWQTDTRLDSWLYTIVRHAWIDELRSRARRERTFEDAGQAEAVPDYRGDASGTLSVDQAMECLPEDQRLAVALVLIEGLPYKEAAQIIGVPMGTLTSRLARGRQALQQLLGPGDGA